MPTDAIREALNAQKWAPTTPFSTRLGELRRLLQQRFDRLPRNPDFDPRVPVVLRLTLDDLALLLPPSERYLLEHLRARKPLCALVGTPGFHSRSRVNHRLQRVISRVHKYSGSVARHRLMGPYDRPGHRHHRRPGRPRRLRPLDEFPQLRVWLPRRFAVLKGYRLGGSSGRRSQQERRRAAQRLLRSQLRPDRYILARRG